jgi:hypothetical protein
MDICCQQTFTDPNLSRKDGKSETVLTMDVHCWHSVSMGRTASNEKVQIVPGVEGPRWITDDRLRTMSMEGGGVGVRTRSYYDDAARRYVCTNFEVFRTPDASEGKGFITSEVLRKLAVGHLIQMALLNLPDLQVTRELPNPDNVEPWGWTLPEGLREEGPTNRVLRWVAHLYLHAMAVSMNPAKAVEDRLGLSHSTAGRWIRQARQKGYLGPSEGQGRAAG